MKRAHKSPEKILKQFEGQPITVLENRYRNLTQTVQDIQAQLSNKSLDRGGGVIFTEAQYVEWRTNAAWSMRHNLAKQRATKDALKMARRRFNTDTPLRPATELVTAPQLIHAALVVLRRLQGELEEPLEDEDLQVIDALDRFLRESVKVGS